MTQAGGDSAPGQKPSKKGKNNSSNNNNNSNKKGHAVFKKTERKWKAEEKEIEKLAEKYADIDTAEIKAFADLPLSTATQRGLKEAGFDQPTGEGGREGGGLGGAGIEAD